MNAYERLKVGSAFTSREDRAACGALAEAVREYLHSNDFATFARLESAFARVMEDE